jgi:hypothetical protein
MVELQPSKLVTWVRFPSPAPFLPVEHLGQDVSLAAFSAPASLASVAEPFVLDERFRAISVAVYWVRSNSARIMKKTRVLNPLQPLEAGQVWKMEALHVCIRNVGKLLVDYRHYKADPTKGSSSSITKRELERFLTKNKAVLVQE